MSRQQIIDDIGSQAKREIDEIERQSAEAAAKRLEAVESRKAEIIRDADQKITDENQRVQSRFARIAAQEERRTYLNLQERVVRNVTDRVAGEFLNLRKHPEYPWLLIEWTIEAAIGLGYGEAQGLNQNSPAKARLRCSPEDVEVLRKSAGEIQNRFQSITGRQIHLEMDEVLLPAGAKGIVLIDESGRTAYSNTVSDRFRRAEPEIRKLVMGRLFPGRKE